MIPPNHSVHFLQYKPGKWQAESSFVISETPVSLTVNGEEWLTFMCTPVDLEAMAIGFLYNEKIIKSIDEVESWYICPRMDNVDIWLNHHAEKPNRWRRTSGCSGGTTSVDQILEGDEMPEIKAEDGFCTRPEQITVLINELLNSQPLYKMSGGVHTSAICDREKIRLFAEDIGRHNTLDKLAGRLLLDKISLNNKIILTTGRISSEMLQKSARLGAAIVVSRTSPSSLSIQLAEKLGITLIGYARRDRFSVYTHPHRLLSAREAHNLSSDMHFSHLPLYDRQ